jgi:RNA recognition motif-containing protein
MDDEHYYDIQPQDHNPSENGSASNYVVGSAALRPVFLGNLNHSYNSADVRELFERPINPPNSNFLFLPVPVDRVDLKRGYCFVFLKDALSQEAKENAERFVSDINGMYVAFRISSLEVYHVIQLDA